MTKVSINLEDEMFAFAAQQARQGGYFGVNDYLSALLYRALLREQAHCDRPAMSANDEEGCCDDELPF